MKRIAMVLVLTFATTAMASASQREYGLLDGLSAIAHRMIELGVTMPSTERFNPNVPVPMEILPERKEPRVGMQG